MAIAPGSRIGPYEVSALVGAGGMGEVFRATDVHLGRAAAIKVLPSSLSGDPERLARFEREAQTLASLNHPNIAQVFGFEKGDGNFRALAMEFVDGPTLADRIATGPLPVDEAIAIAIQIADALESAHDHGIIHRDLKPQNIKVRDDGVVKVLDFGLAKALTSAADPASGTFANSPTITTPAMTAAGMVLGTAAYMSPEQAKGRVVDRRADVWAFGCVLFEMLTGKRAFAGGDVSDVFVSILRDEPQWSALPAGTPPPARSLLRRCLQKDLRKRLPHIGVARLELAEPSDQPASERRPGGPWRVLAAAVLLLIAIGVPSWLIWFGRSPAPVSPIRLLSDLGTAQPVLLAGSMALSRDGKTLAFTGRPPTTTLRSVLYVRPLERRDAQLLAGTESAQSPFFSPNGASIAFFAEGMLKKVGVGGGPVITICAAPTPAGGWWADDDTIVYSSAATLHRVPSAGGTPAPVLTAASGQIPAFPQVLPRGRGILYSSSTTTDAGSGSVFVQDFSGSAPKQILEGGRLPRYVESGHLTFVRTGTLFAVPFDLDVLGVAGEPEPVVDDVYQAPMTGAPNLAISSNGTLAYQPGGASQSWQAPLMWMDQAGALTALRATPATFGFPRFSPDGTRLAMAISDGGPPDIWVYDWQREVLTKVTSDPAQDLAPVWTPDGTGLVFASGRETSSTGANLYWQRADGTGAAERLTTSPTGQLPFAFDPGGRTLVFVEGNPATNRQTIGVLPVERDPGGRLKAGTPRELIGGPFLKSSVRVSPDGKWIAYAAYDTGTFEIYVQPFPALGNRVQVTSGGGSLAVWSRTKSELYYSGAGMQQMMVVPYTIKDAVFVPDKPRPWSPAKFSPTPPIGQYGPGFDLHPDGERFAVTSLAEPLANASGRGQVVLFLNFFDELRRLAPLR